MKIENIEVGMTVEVKKKAFGPGGSLSLVYDEVPRDRTAVVTQMYCVYRLVISLDDHDWAVEANEIRFPRSLKNAPEPVAEYYMYRDRDDMFVVRSANYPESGVGAFSGQVVCNVISGFYLVGHVSDTWEASCFAKCNYTAENN